MDFFDKLGKKASETYQVTKDKTNKFSGEMKLKLKINENNNKAIDLFEEIGELVYEQYKSNSNNKQDEITAKCEEVSAIKDEIKKLEHEVLLLKEKKKCVECGTELEYADEFCSKCGKKQPLPNVDVKVENESVESQNAIEVENMTEENNNEE